MHPVANAGLSVTASEALTTALIWLISLAHVTVPDNVAQSFAVLIAIGVSYAVHRVTKTAPASVPPTPFFGGFTVQGDRIVAAPTKPADPAPAAPVQGT